MSVDEFASGIAELLREGRYTFRELVELAPGADPQELEDKLARMQVARLVRKRGTKFELTSPPVLRLAQEIKTHPSILEARVTGCLIKHPGSTAREIAFETGELTGRVVHCLKRMNHLGVVYHAGHTQRAYYARNPLRRRYFLRTYFVFMLGAGGKHG